MKNIITITTCKPLKLALILLICASLVIHLYVANTYLNKNDQNWKKGSRKAGFSQQIICERVPPFVYVKTHKTASSTVRSILGHRGIPSLQALPKPFYGGYPGLFNKDFIEYQANIREQITANNSREESQSPLQMIAGHFRFHETTIKSMMPPNTKYISIIRDPLREFESAFNYYYKTPGNSPSKLRRIPCFAAPYLLVAKKFDVSLSEYIEAAVTSLNDSIPFYFRSRNYQSFDLGMDPKKTDDEAYIRSYIEELDKTFDLVMINEYFFESLVLLREVLCFTWDDLRFKQLVVGHYNKHNYTEDEQLKLVKLLRQDFMLYDHMNKSFWEKVEKYGRERMENDVAFLKAKIGKTNWRRISKSRTKRDVALNAKGPRLEWDIKRTKKNMDTLKNRIKIQCQMSKCTMDEKKIDKLANYMADSGGYCPY